MALTQTALQQLQAYATETAGMPRRLTRYISLPVTVCCNHYAAIIMQQTQMAGQIQLAGHQ